MTQYNRIGVIFTQDKRALSVVFFTVRKLSPTAGFKGIESGMQSASDDWKTRGEQQARSRMRNTTHRSLSWLLMLALMLAPLQSVLALDSGKASMSSACLQMMADDDEGRGAGLSASGPAPCNQPSSPLHCPEMPGCSVFSGLSLFPSSSLSPVPRAALVFRLRHSDTRLTTRYPDLLQRPPRV